MSKAKNIFSKYFSPSLRIFIGLLFVTSGILKLTNIEAFKYTLFSLNFFNSGISNILSYAIPIIEVFLGLLLALGIFIKFAAVHTNVLVFLFAFVTFYAVSKNLNLSCGCFGGLWDMKFSGYHLLSLLLIFVLNIFIIFDFNNNLSLKIIIKNKHPLINKELVVKIIVVFFVFLGCLIIIIALLFNFTDYGRNIKNNLIEKINKPSMVKTITVDEAYQIYTSKEDCIFLDVRSPEEYMQSHIKGAILIPVTEIDKRMSRLPKDKLIIVYCDGSGCSRSGMAARILLENGFKVVYDMIGKGIFEWQEKGYPIQTGK